MSPRTPVHRIRPALRAPLALVLLPALLLAACPSAAPAPPSSRNPVPVLPDAGPSQPGSRDAGMPAPPDAGSRGDAGTNVEPPRAPNVVVIFADDLGYGHLGSYGQREIRTPNLDRLAAEGARFTQFYSGGPWCPPARTSLLTGWHTGHTPLRGGGVFTDDEELLPAAFRRRGYRTALFGKWGFNTHVDGSAIEGASPHTLGFDEFTGFLTHRDAHVYYLDGTSAEGPNRVAQTLFTLEPSTAAIVPFPVAPDRYLPDEFLDHALAFLDAHADEPFFLFFPTQLPHAELVAPPEGLGPYAEGGVSVFEETPFGGNPTYPEPVAAPLATLAAMITRLDTDVGRLLDRLDELGLRDDTLVLFTSDNGPHAAGGIDDPRRLSGSGPLSGRKFDVLEGGLRVPMIARWPGHIEAGVVVEAPYALWDIDRTLRDLIDEPHEVMRDGVSLLPALQGDDGGAVRELYFETYALGGQTLVTSSGRVLDQRAALRIGDQKAIRVREPETGEYVLLFDLDADLREDLDRDRSSAPGRCADLVELTARMNALHVDVPGGELAPLRALCQVLGSAGDDVLDGTAAAERLIGREGADVLRGLDGDDEVLGGPGDDDLNGNVGDDFVQGNSGDDVVRGGQGHDTVRGGSGNDTLYGDLGDDHLYGDLGDDVAFGGPGDDHYYYRAGDGSLRVHGEGSGSDTLHCEGTHRASERREGDDRVLTLSDGGEVRLVGDFVQANVTLSASCLAP